MTGSAGWAYHAVTHWMLGVRLFFEGMIIDPCIPAEWKEFEVTRRWRGATFIITVKNPKGVQRGVRSVKLDGQPVEGVIKPQISGTVHKIDVIMG